MSFEAVFNLDIPLTFAIDTVPLAQFAVSTPTAKFCSPVVVAKKTAAGSATSQSSLI
jgi:hypothetical protein